MNRRQFMKASIVSSVGLVGLGGGTLLLIEGANKSELSIDFALKKLTALSSENLMSIGEWNPQQIFSHCAQSIEYSMSAFPAHKSSFFKGTLGKLAFSAFSQQGRMTHNLSEPIPGSPSLSLNIDVQIGLNRLIKSLMAFDAYQGVIAPHFAYGELTKKEYELAHLMHLYNHLQEITYKK